MIEEKHEIKDKELKIMIIETFMETFEKLLKRNKTSRVLQVSKRRLSDTLFDLYVYDIECGNVREKRSFSC